jgi:hypothetical protein
MMARVKMLAAAVSVLIAALLASWLGGRKSAQTAAKAKELKDYAQTRKRMDAAPDGDDPAVLRDWLRERGERSSDL